MWFIACTLCPNSYLKRKVYLLSVYWFCVSGHNKQYSCCWNELNKTSVNTLNHLALSHPDSSIVNFSSHLRLPRCTAACKDSKRALEVSQHSEDMGLILGACAGGLVVLILLLGAIVIIVKKGWVALSTLLLDCETVLVSGVTGPSRELNPSLSTWQPDSAEESIWH